MAKIKLGPNILEISGSIGNVIYSRYCVGRHAAKSRPGTRSNPQSPRQACIRRYTKDAGAAWHDTLTPQQRDNWNVYAKGLKRQESSQHSICSMIPQNRGIMSGFHAFLGAFVQVSYAGLMNLPVFADSPLGQTPPSALTTLRADWEPDITPNYALDFDGVDEDVTLQNVLAYDYNQPQSWEIWAKVDSLGNPFRLLSKINGVLNTGYQVLYIPPDLIWSIQRDSAAEAIQKKRAFAITGSWAQSIVTYDGSNTVAGMQIYINSVSGSVPRLNVPITATIVHADPLLFASQAPSVTTWLDGKIGQVRNFNRQLLQADVDILFNGGAGLYSTNPFIDGSCIGAWMFCTGSGNTLFDGAGFGLDGTLRNMEAGDWVPGKVPCPLIPAHVLIEWSDPIIVTAGSVIRIWIRSRELGVHKQLVRVVALDEEEFLLRQVSMAQGAVHNITDFPGHYLIQADVIQPNGLKSPPSRTVEVTVP